MVFRPSRVRRILMQFYVWKNINGLFTFALSTPEDRLHDIIVFFTSEVLDFNYWFKDGNNILDLSRNQVFLLPNCCIRYYLISSNECSLFLKTDTNATNINLGLLFMIQGALHFCFTSFAWNLYWGVHKTSLWMTKILYHVKMNSKLCNVIFRKQFG